MRIFAFIFLMFTSNITFAHAANLTPVFVDVQIQPEVPAASQPLVIYLSLNTEFEGPAPLNNILEARLDGVTQSLLLPTSGLFILAVESISVGPHTLSVDYFIEDKEQADGLRFQILQTQNEISDLEGKIAIEDDASQLTIWEMQKNAREADLLLLQSSLSSLKTLISSETSTFTVQ